MDISISVICYKSKVLADGKSPVMLRFMQNGHRALKSLGISVNPNHWDFRKNCLKSSCPDHTELSTIISQTLAHYQQKLLTEKALGKKPSLNKFIAEDGTAPRHCTIGDFLTDLIDHLRKEEKIGNSYAYLNLKTTLSNFSARCLRYQFSDIDVDFCLRFERWMRKQKYTDITMHFYFRTLRSTFNKAVAEHYVNVESSPFTEYKLNRFKTKTQKRAITKVNAMKMIKANCSHRSDLSQLAHAVFAFSYYCGGMSFTDVAHLTPDNIINGRIVYQRQKTHSIINLPLLPEARDILDTYDTQKHDSGFLFPILDNRIHTTKMSQYHRVRKLTGQINKELQNLAEDLGIKDHITTYVSRHTFATVLKRSGVNIAIISQALGHQDIKTTQIYLDSFENDQVDEAMRNLT